MSNEPVSTSASARGQISRRYRGALGIFGLASWLAGSVATFVTSNSAGAAALIAVGGAGGALAMVGRWPSRLAMSGNEFIWDEVRETVDDQISVVQSSGEAEVVRELKLLRSRLDSLKLTGVVPQHPAAEYDQAVERAIRTLLPSAEVGREDRRSRQAADFTIRDRDQHLLVETKWRSRPDEPFHGSTLPQLVDRLSSDDRLLVVTNSRNIRSAVERLRRLMAKRALVVSWQSEVDNNELQQAMQTLLAD